MFASLIALSLGSSVHFAEPRPWSLGFADSAHIALVGDVDHDGLADMISVSPKGDCSIDVSLNVGGYKAGPAFQAISGWGHDCQAAVTGEFDEVPGADVVGIFDGKTLRLAGGFSEGHFKDTPNWVSLPGALKQPELAVLKGGAEILAFSSQSGAAFRVETKTRSVARCSVPSGMVWIGDEGDRLVGQDRSGKLFWIDPVTFAKGGRFAFESKDSIPAAGPGFVAFGDQLWTPSGVQNLPLGDRPSANTVREVGVFEPQGQPAILEFRRGAEMHTGNQVLLRVQDADAGKGQDTANDGLPDDWKLNGFRGLDLKALGCQPGHADVVCLVSRFADVDEKRFKSEIDRVIGFYANLKVKNPDGTTGIHFHPIFLPPVVGDDQKNPWWANRDKFRPEKWRGVVHWMQVTRGGGGQADQLGDGGTVGEGALWAVFVHEFGHQLGLDHQGFWPTGSCPIYTSLMNYNYSYGFEDDYNKIHYSDGSLSKVVLKETDLDEVLPYPYEKVKFLEQGPYHFRLKPNGATTLVDWNWNGVFGEHHIRADVNYAYSTTAGPREDVGKTKVAPWLFVHKGQAYALLGVNNLPVDPKVDPSLSPERPGSLLMKRMVKPRQWDQPWTIEAGGLIGDPVAASFNGRIVTVYPTGQGVLMRQISTERAGVSMSPPTLVADDKSLVPTVGVYAGRLFIYLWNPGDGKVRYRVLDSKGSLSPEQELDVTSTNPVGMTTDTLTGEAVLGMGQDQDKNRPFRWQVRRYILENGKLVGHGMEWVEGANGGARGQGRITVLFDSSRDAGPHGRIYLFGRGTITKENPWACTYVAMQIADKTVHGGWLVKRYYDEWSQSRSAPAAAWFQNDVLFAYRWIDGGQGPTDNTFHLGYHGLGIEDAPMGDHDDLSFIRNFGLRNSLLTLGRG